MKTILFIGLITLTGCSSLGDKLNSTIANYCTKDVIDRNVLKQVIKDELKPNNIEVFCAADQ